MELRFTTPRVSPYSNSGNDQIETTLADGYRGLRRKDCHAARDVASVQDGVRAASFYWQFFAEVPEMELTGR